MRLFVAVDVAPRLSSLRVDDSPRRCGGAPSWRRAPASPGSPPERLHLTVRFIGDVDDDRRGAIAAALAPPLAVAPFDLTLAGVGAFPPTGAPRVLWAGVDDGRESTAARSSARSATGSTASASRLRSAPYSPHLTLARVRDADGLRSPCAARRRCGSRRSARRRVDAITLFESRLSPKGPTYTCPCSGRCSRPSVEAIADAAMEDVVRRRRSRYLVGSVPFAFLLARRRGIDLRRVGSGNVGATNVLRTSGVRDRRARDGARRGRRARSPCSWRSG